MSLPSRWLVGQSKSINVPVGLSCTRAPSQVAFVGQYRRLSEYASEYLLGTLQPPGLAALVGRNESSKIVQHELRCCRDSSSPPLFAQRMVSFCIAIVLGVKASCCPRHLGCFCYCSLAFFCTY